VLDQAPLFPLLRDLVLGVAAGNRLLSARVLDQAPLFPLLRDLVLDPAAGNLAKRAGSISTTSRYLYV
jgi:hypothetical protein